MVENRKAGRFEIILTSASIRHFHLEWRTCTEAVAAKNIELKKRRIRVRLAAAVDVVVSKKCVCCDDRDSEREVKNTA